MANGLFSPSCDVSVAEAAALRRSKPASVSAADAELCKGTSSGVF